MTISQKECIVLNCTDAVVLGKLCAAHYALPKLRLVNMINRCHNSRNKAYPYYGGRGITVCDRWRYGSDGMTNWETFLFDMGVPDKGLSIDRVDNDKGYSPDNCRWATITQQNRNKRTNQHDTPSYIYKHYGAYRVQFSIDGKMFSFGAYKDIEEATSVRDCVKEQIDSIL